MHFLGRRLFLLVCLAGGVLRIAQAQNVLFPIGIFGVVSNIGTPYASGTGTTLDKIKGSPELGYLSGFNVVQSYWHKSNFDHVSNSGMGKFLNHAASLGFSVLVTIPGSYETIPDGKFTAPGDTVQGKIISPPGEGPHLLQRSPPDCSEAIGLISMIKSRRSVYGYYTADEPTDVYSVRAFYSKAVSAQNLALAPSSARTQTSLGPA